jgi:hypothetical protein
MTVKGATTTNQTVLTCNKNSIFCQDQSITFRNAYLQSPEHSSSTVKKLPAIKLYSRKLNVTTTQVPHECRFISQVVAYRHTQDSYSKLRDKTATVPVQLSSVTSGRVRPLSSSSRFQLFSRNVICYYRKKLKKIFMVAFILAKCHKQISSALRTLFRICHSYISLKLITRWWEQCGSHFRAANISIKLWPASQQTFHIFFSRMLRSKRANGVAHHTGMRLLEQNGEDDRKIHEVHAPRKKPPIEDQSALVAAAATLVTWQTYSVKRLVTLTLRLSRCISTRGSTWPKNIYDCNTRNDTEHKLP